MQLEVLFEILYKIHNIFALSASRKYPQITMKVAVFLKFK